MPSFVLKDAHFDIAGVDLSDHVESIAVTYEGEEVDDTVMGDTARSRAGDALLNWTATITLQQDFAAAKVDATMFPIVGTNVAVEFGSDTTNAISATNPRYTGTGNVGSYGILGNQVGELAKAPITIRGVGVLIRDVTP